MDRNERLARTRKHGTLGAAMLACPDCGLHWLCAVRWDRLAGKFRPLTWESTICGPCWRRYARVRRGRPLRRLGEFEGDFNALRGWTEI